MAVQPRITLFYKDLSQGYGWTYTLWSGQVSSLQSAVTVANNWQSGINQCMAANVICTHVRFSDQNAPRSSFELPGAEPASLGSSGSYPYNAALAGQYSTNSNLVQLLRLYAGVMYQGALFISGLPAAHLISLSQAGPGLPAVNQALANLTTFLATGALGMYILPKPGDGVVAKPVQNIVFTLNEPTITCTAHGFSSGQRVSCSGAQMTGGRFSFSNLPVLVTDANTFSVPNFARRNHGIYSGGGNVWAVNKSVRFLSLATNDGITTHKRGRFSPERRGKVRTH